MNKKLIVNKESAFRNDECYISTIEKNNKKLFDLQFLPSIYQNNKKQESSRKEYIASSKVLGTLQATSYDMSGKNINISTKIRNGEGNENKKCNDLKSRKELDTRLFPGAPLVARGQSVLKNTDLSSRLIYGEDTRTKKSGNVAAAYSADNFIPMVPCLAENVQNTEHIIPTYWIRGGMSTRTVIRNIDYLKSCGLRE